LDKRLTPERNRFLLIIIQLIRTTAISLPTLFEGGRLLVLKTKSFASAAGSIKRPLFYQPLQPGLRKRGFLRSRHYFVTILRTTSFVTD
jgi:hypothetical protein